MKNLLSTRTGWICAWFLGLLSFVSTSLLAGENDLLHGIPRKEYSERRGKVMKQLEEGEILLLKGTRNKYDAQEDDFYYLTGSIYKTGYLLITQNEVVFYLPARNRRRERWVGPLPAPDGRTRKKYGIASIRDRNMFPEQFKKQVKSRNIHTVYLNKPANEFPVEKTLENIKNKTSSRRLTSSLRLRKSPAELKQLAHAATITQKALREVIGAIHPGMGEWEAEAIIEYTFRRNGAQRPGYNSIVGSGPNSTILHYKLNNRRMKKGELVLMDVGAMYNHYTADVTRTVPVSGTFTDKQKKIYNIVLKAQKKAVEAAKPGNSIVDIHRAASRVISEAGYGGNFNHGTSHWLGLNVHDPGGRKTLKPGMVLTIEPGIYLPDSNIGIRIEDDVVITQNGSINLTEDLPRSVKEIEQMMKGGDPGYSELGRVELPDQFPWLNKIYPDSETNSPTESK